MSSFQKSRRVLPCALPSVHVRAAGWCPCICMCLHSWLTGKPHAQGTVCPEYGKVKQVFCLGCRVLMMQCSAGHWLQPVASAVQARRRHAHCQASSSAHCIGSTGLQQRCLGTAHASPWMNSALSLAHVAGPGAASLPLKAPCCPGAPCCLSMGMAGQTQAPVPVNPKPACLVMSAPCPCVCLHRPLPRLP